MHNYALRVAISVCTAFSFFGTVSAFASENIENHTFKELINDSSTLQANDNELETLSTELWNKFFQESQSLSNLKNEFQSKALHYKDKTMKFSMETKGNPGANGFPLYIALHGGGGAPPSLNDSQWRAMQYYYKDSVNQGVYVAPRGVTDTWNLHFVDESYPLYERMIEDMVLFAGVDPNRVYFLGFSAGGDGVYQVVPRMPDRFAAANMSAGHHNWIGFENLFNTPFLIQVGERDSAYNRNRVGAENYLALNDLNTKYGGGFVHDLFLHVGGSHNSWHDNDSGRRQNPVVANAKDWLDGKGSSSKNINTNAIDWMNNYTRNPTPTKLVWDLKTSAPRTLGIGAALLNSQGGNAPSQLALPQQLFYWLDVSVAHQFPDQGKLVVELDKNTNTLKVQEVANVEKFRVLLNTHMLDLSKPIHVLVGDQYVASPLAKANLKTMTRTLLERSDRNFIFDAEVTLSFNKNQNSWELVEAL